METQEDLRQLYRELADHYEDRAQPQFRDRFLMLAAGSAFAAGDLVEAEHQRQRLLAVNPHHLVKPFASFAEAMESADVQVYLNDLRRNYPIDVTVELLRSIQPRSEADRLVPATAPVIDFGSGPDLLMDDDFDPSTIETSVTEPRTVAPTLPPGHFHRQPAPVPATMPRPSRSLDQTPMPRVLKPEEPRPPTVPQRKIKAIRVLRRQPVKKPQDTLPSGAWLPALLFGWVGAGAVALAVYVLIGPFLGW